MDELVNLLETRSSKYSEIGEKNQIYADIASSAQKLLEDLLFLIFKHELTNENKFLFSGGVAVLQLAKLLN